MPELPEVEIVKRALFRSINKAKIIDIIIYNTNLRYKISNKFSNNLINNKILKISRRSKYLIFYFKKKLLLVHLGMSGKFLIVRNNDSKIFRTSFYYNLENHSDKHNHIYFILNNGFTLIYNDIRRFGFFKLYENKNLNEIVFLNKLGPEPLSKLFNTSYFTKNIKNKKKNIKNLLMDQTFVSGLGNIYVNEVLFKCKIYPLKSCINLDKKNIQDLVFNIKKTLKISISKGGSSIKNFKNTLGKIGHFQELFNVYGRENKKCKRSSCNGNIKRLKISNRACFYCEKCQKLN